MILKAAATLPEFAQKLIYEFAFGMREHRRAKARYQILFNQLKYNLSTRLMHKRAMEYVGLQLDTFLAHLKVFGIIDSFTYPSEIPGRIYMNNRITPVFPDAQSTMEFGVTWHNRTPTKSIIIFSLTPDSQTKCTFTILGYGRSTKAPRTYMSGYHSATTRVYNNLIDLIAELSSF
jgi:hypothetical protein